jgi:hypothetical protein
MKKVRKNIFEELDKVKKLILDIDPKLDMKEFPVLLGKLGTYHYNRKGMLLGTDRKLYNVLIENSYNPFTVYKWSLLERIPEDVRYQLKAGIISQKKASRLSYKRRTETGTSLQVDLKQHGLILIRGL